ncbi:MAG: NfeD family protein [Firmicutes bacterium]|uniref:NfeD family protein n=1 Tax=Candidatus Scatoplasma merdavium TaxID=2840932 RepID=A0A9D9D8S4_9BACL|nr:NfeD family protein [Candidatus Scatoplasma merdavium]
MEQYMIYIWLGVLILSIIVEAATTSLVSIWFAGGALIAMILSIPSIIPFWVEIIAFVVVSIVLMICFRSLSLKLLKRSTTRSNIDEIIGSKGVIIKKVTPIERGEVKINDIVWTAMSYQENETIEVDTIVEVCALKGNKLYVKPINNK